jgi:integrase/recombinase XerD
MIKGAKGNKDRKVPLNKEWLKYLANYAKSEGHKKGYDKPIFYPYSESSIYQIVKRKAKEAGISKRVYPHLLRDCYASHLLHQGIDPIFIQEILGHEKLETTRKYIHISAVNISEIALKIA